MSKTSIQLLAFLAAGVSPLLGDTVAWYRFNEGTMGEKVLPSVTIENSANPGHLTGKCQQIAYSATSALSDDTDRLPIATNAFPAGMGVQDNVGKAKFANERALFFRTDNLGWNNMADCGKGSAVAVPYDDAFSNKTFSAECFFKSAVRDGETSERQTLFSMPGLSSSGNTYPAYALSVDTNGTLHVEMTDQWWGTKTLSSPTTLATVNDGKWHHAAITFDNSTKILTIYLDYAKVASENFPYLTPQYKAASEATRFFAIGATPGYGWFRKFNGWIDEVRISNVALEPINLLRNASYNADIDAPSTVCHVSFDGMGQNDAFAYATWTNLNALTAYDAPAAWINWSRSYGGAEPITDSESIPAGRFYNARSDAGQTVANASSMHFATNANTSVATAASATLFINDLKNGEHAVLKGSFTLEMFARASETLLLNDSNQQRGGYIACLGDRLLWMETKPSGSLSIGVRTTASTSLPEVVLATVPGFVNDKWHHVALVYNRETLTARAYVDYTLAASVSGVDLVVANHTKPLAISGWNSDVLYTWSADLAFNGWVDEVRLSNCALSKSDFLSATRTKLGFVIVVR